MFYITVLLECRFIPFGRVNHWFLHLKFMLPHRFELFKDTCYMCVFCWQFSGELRKLEEGIKMC